MRGKRSQAHTRSPVQDAVLGRKVSITSGCRNQQGLKVREMEGFWSPRPFLLKGLHTDLLGLTPSEFQCWGSSLKGTRGIWRETELSGIKARAGGAAFFQTEVQPEAIVPLMSPPPTEPAGRHHI